MQIMNRGRLEMTKMLKKVVLSILKSMSDPFYAGVAAELAFFFLLSIIPTVLLLGRLSGFFSVSLNFFIEFINTYTPEEFAELIMPYLEPDSAKSLSIIFFVFSLWLASRGFFALIRISNYAYNIEMDGPFNFSERFKAMKITLLLLFMIIFGLLIVIYGRLIGEFITKNSAVVLGHNIVIDDIWYMVRWPLAFFVFYWIMIYVYSRSPNYHLPAKKVRPGAIFSTAGIIVSSLVFSFYVSHFANYDILYGSLANVISLMLWFYLIGYVIVIGIHINIAFEKTH